MNNQIKIVILKENKLKLNGKYMKILHLSDIHLGKRPAGAVGEYSKKRFEDYFKAFAHFIDYAIENEIDTIIIAGDFFDRKDLTPDVLQEAEKILEKARAAMLPIVLIEGNHDNINNESDSWLIYLQNKKLISRPYFKLSESGYEFYPVTIENINFYGIGYCGMMFKEVIRQFAAYIHPEEKENTILLLHTGIGSESFLPGLIDGETLELLKDKVIYAAGGHLHSYYHYPKENPFFFIPGSLEYWDIKESQQKKGGIVFDTQTKEHTFIPSKRRTVRYYKLETQAAQAEEIWEELLNIINLEEIVKGEDIALLELKLNSASYPDINQIEKKLEEAGFLKSFIYLKTGKASDFQSSSSFIIEEIEQEIIAGWEPLFADNLEIITNYLEKFKNEYKSTVQFTELFDSMLGKLIEGEAKC